MNPEPGTSLTLLHRLHGGEPNAWTRFVYLYEPLIGYWCRRWSINPADIEDLSQEVLRAVVTHLPEFQRRSDSGSFRAWLRGITRNKLLEYGRNRRGKPLAAGGSSALAAIHAIPEAAPELAESSDELADLYLRAAEAIRGDFTPQTWDIFWRTTVESQSPADVAADLGLKPAAVRMAKARVLRRLRDEIGDFAE